MAAYTTIDNPELHFQVVLYTGAGAKTFGGEEDMQPDFVWIKGRNAQENHAWFDVGRGVQKYMGPSRNDAEATSALTLTAFGSNGFTVSTAGITGYGSQTYVAYGWKVQGAAGSANEDGSVNTTSTSVNSTTKFSIGLYTGTGSAGMTVGHGLGVAPDFIVVKKRAAADRWCAYHSANTSAPETEAIYLSETDATADDADFWNDVAPSSTLVTFGDKGDINAAVTTVMYCWSAVQGFSKFGSYVGNGSTDGTFVYTGFRPAFLLIKSSSNAGTAWQMWDNKRASSFNPITTWDLTANATTAEDSIAAGVVDFLSNGFKMRKVGGDNNGSGYTYIYMACAEAPFVNSEGVPCNAR